MQLQAALRCAYGMIFITSFLKSNINLCNLVVSTHSPPAKNSGRVPGTVGARWGSVVNASPPLSSPLHPRKNGSCRHLFVAEIVRAQQVYSSVRVSACACACDTYVVWGFQCWWAAPRRRKCCEPRPWRLNPNGLGDRMSASFMPRSRSPWPQADA
jgi:hypothetical protein